jgi:hypothetical protein
MFIFTEYIMARKMVQVNERIYDELVKLQSLYKEKFKRFISLGDLINLIISLPTIVKELKGNSNN